MGITLRKTKTFVHTCSVVQYDEKGNPVTGTLRVRFNAISRAQWDELTEREDDDRLLFDVVVDKIEDEVRSEDGTPLAADEALKAIRDDMSLTGQITTQGVEAIFGAAAKNARRSRAR